MKRVIGISMLVIFGLGMILGLPYLAMIEDKSGDSDNNTNQSYFHYLGIVFLTLIAIAIIGGYVILAITLIDP